MYSWVLLSQKGCSQRVSKTGAPSLPTPADWLPLELLEEPALPLKVWSAPWAIRVGGVKWVPDPLSSCPRGCGMAL